MDRDLQIRICEVEKLYYLCSETKGAGKLHVHRAADLRLFSTCKNKAFSYRRPNGFLGFGKKVKKSLCGKMESLNHRYSIVQRLVFDKYDF